MNWQEFETAVPELAATARDRFDQAGVVILGSLRKNGWPRLSPVESLVVDGELCLGMIWRSHKALDLLRDPRCTVHSAVASREGTDGDVKLYGRAVSTEDLEARRRYCDALYEKIGWKPEEPRFHVFAFNIETAGFTIVEGDEIVAKRWRSEEADRIYVKRFAPNSASRTQWKLQE